MRNLNSFCFLLNDSLNVFDVNKLSPDNNEECTIVTKPQLQSSFSDDSPQDEEPPYIALNTGLKRYGTMSSLEKVPSEDTDENEKTYGSSDEDSENGKVLMSVKLRTLLSWN